METRQALHPAPRTLAAFALNRLPADARERLQAHLRSCAACSDFLARTPQHELQALLGGSIERSRAEQSTPGERNRDTIQSPGPPPLPAQTSAGIRPPNPAEPAATEAIPAALREQSKYRVVRLLGRGGMGSVYEARHERMDRRVAIKVINPELIGNPQAIERFNAEVQAVSKLDHTNIARAYDAETFGSLQAIIMEFVEGQTLYDFLKAHQRSGHPLSVIEACRLVRQALVGLQHAHERGIAHRDLKPQNLMLTRDKGIVKILDFGLAKLSDGRARGLTKTHVTMGTYEYMAPEQALDAATAGIRADIYSLGCTLYYLLAGVLPFEYDTDVKLLLAHQNEIPRSLVELRPDVPQELSDLVARMLAKNPADRPQTPAEAAQILLPYAKGEVPAPAATQAAAAPAAEAGLADLFDEIAHASTPTRGHQTRPSARRTQTSTVRRYWPLAATASAALLGGIILFSGVFKVRTPDGTIVLRVSQPNAEVLVDGQTITVHWGDDGKSAEITAPPGKHRVEVKKQGFVVSGTDVTLEDAGHEILNVALESAVKPELPKIANSNPPRTNPAPAAPVATPSERGSASPAPAQAAAGGLSASGPSSDAPANAPSESAAQTPVPGVADASGPANGPSDNAERGAAANSEPEGAPSKGATQVAPHEANRFVPLFDGKSLDGWTIDGNDKSGWSVERGAIVARGVNSKTRNYLLTDREYSDYVLRLEFSVETATSAGVAVRAIPGENVPQGGGALLFDHPMVKLIGNPGKEQTGTTDWVVDGILVAPNRAAKMRPFGAWNQMEVSVQGTRLRVKVNGTQIVNTSVRHDARFPSGTVPGLCREGGRIGLQKHTGTVRYRNIEVMELPLASTSQEGAAPSSSDVVVPPPNLGNVAKPAEAGIAVADGVEWKSLFDGKTLRGWKEFGGNAHNWEAADGLIHCKGLGGGASLESVADYANFELQLEYRMEGGGNSGVYLRVPTRLRPGQNPSHLGMEIQLLDDQAPEYAHLPPADYCGSVWDVVGAERGFAQPAGEWGMVEILCDHRHVKVTLNGHEVVDADLDEQATHYQSHPGITPEAKSGHVGLQYQTGALDFRNVRIRVLGGSPVDAIQPGSVWRDSNKVLTILERNGDTFRARFDLGQAIVREVTGSVKDDRLWWLAGNVRAIRGKPGDDNFGTIHGDRIDFTWGPNRTTSGTFTLVREK